MTDAHRPTPAQSGDTAPDGPEPRDATSEPAAVRDPTAGRDASRPSGLESSGGGAGSDPDALDQSVGRGDAGQGDGAI